jgi:hypothetical protein
MSLPTEILIHISKFLDKETKYKLYSVINYKVCCSYEKQLTYFAASNNRYNFDDIYDDIYFCNLCKKYICFFCYESGELHVDHCYRCNLSICSECNDDGTFLKYIFIYRCNLRDCYYCTRGHCYNNKIEWCCEKCINESDVYVDSDTSDS